MICLSGLSIGLAAGCAQPTAEIPQDTISDMAGYEAAEALIKKDPMAFLHEVYAETQKLDSLRTEFHRQERLGAFKELRPQERIQAAFRKRPFSVRFKWLDEDSEYNTAVYVEGEHDNKVALLPRKGLLGLPPGVAKYPVDFAVLFHKSRNPITDFGPERMVERTIDRIEKAGHLGEVSIRYHGVAEIGPYKEPCFHLEIRYPEDDPYESKLHDLYVNTKTRLPVGTYLWLPGKDERAVETLDAMYLYADLEPNVHLSDADFRIDADRRSAGKQDRRRVRTASDGAESAAPEAGAE